MPTGDYCYLRSTLLVSTKFFLVLIAPAEFTLARFVTREDLFGHNEASKKQTWYCIVLALSTMSSFHVQMFDGSMGQWARSSVKFGWCRVGFKENPLNQPRHRIVQHGLQQCSLFARIWLPPCPLRMPQAPNSANSSGECRLSVKPRLPLNDAP